MSALMHKKRSQKKKKKAKQKQKHVGFGETSNKKRRNKGLVGLRQKARQEGKRTESQRQKSGLGSFGLGQHLDVYGHCGAGIRREHGEEVARCFARFGVEGREGGRDRCEEPCDHIDCGMSVYVCGGQGPLFLLEFYLDMDGLVPQMADPTQKYVMYEQHVCTVSHSTSTELLEYSYSYRCGDEGRSVCKSGSIRPPSGETCRTVLSSAMMCCTR